MALLREIVVPILLIATCLCGPSSGRNPGISLRMSEEAFQLVLDQVKPIIKILILTAPIPQSIPYHIPGINTDMHLNSMHLLENTFRFDSDTHLMPDGTADGLNLLVSFRVEGVGSWTTRAAWWPHITSSGGLVFTFNPLLVAVSMKMSPGAGGLWNFTLSDLNVKPSFGVRFIGGILSVFDIGALETYINIKAQQYIGNAVHKAAGEALGKLTPLMEKYLPYVHLPQDCDKGFLPPICKDFAVNLSLTSAGVWKDRCYGEVQLDGYALYRNKGFNPAASKPFPAIPSPCGDRHLSLLLSGSTFTSAINAVLASGKVNVNVPSGMFCDDPTIGLFIPGLGKTFGHQPLYANITLINSKFSLTPGRATVSINTIFQALADTTPKGQKARTFEKAFTMDTTISISLNAWIKPLQTPKGMYSMLYLNFTSATVESASVPSSSVGYIPAFAIKDMVEVLIVGATSKADKILTDGAIVFPRQVNNISIVRPEILIGEGYIKMAFDVDHSRNKSEDVSAQWEAGNKLRSDKSPLADQLVAAVDSLAQSVSDAILEGQEHFLKFVTMMFLMEV